MNAFVHRDYMEIGSEVHLDIFDNRIEITSPGGRVEGLPIQKRDLYHIASRRRNPYLADIFHRLQLMERSGSGIKQIIELIGENSTITQKDLALQIGLSEGGIRKAMAKLKKAGIIRREGSTKSGIWSVMF